MAKYTEWLQPEGLLKIEGWARDGLTDEQIAHNIGIRRETLIAWKKQYPNISNTLKKGKEVVDRQVENALLKRALGYSYIETTKESLPVYDSSTGDILGYKMQVTKEVTKEVQPDTTAQIFWLKNRKPTEWRDKQNIQVEGSLDTTSSLTDEELEDRISRLRSKLGIIND